MNFNFFLFGNRGRLQGKVGGELHGGEGMYAGLGQYLCCFLPYLEVFGTKRKGLVRLQKHVNN